MKELRSIKEKRESLREEYSRFFELKKKHFPSIDSIKNLDADGKKTYGHIMNVLVKLNVQIDALTYVLNEDSELMDATYIYNFNKEDLFKECL